MVLTPWSLAQQQQQHCLETLKTTSQVPPRPTESETPGVGPIQPCLKKSSRWFWYSLKFQNHQFKVWKPRYTRPSFSCLARSWRLIPLSWVRQNLCLSSQTLEGLSELHKNISLGTQGDDLLTTFQRSGCGSTQYSDSIPTFFEHLPCTMPVLQEMILFPLPRNQ